MPRVKPNTPRRLSESQQGDVGNRLPFQDVVTIHSDQSDDDSDVVLLSDVDEDQENNSARSSLTRSHEMRIFDEEDQEFYEEPPVDYFEQREKIEIEDLEMRQRFREQREYERMRCSHVDDFDSSLDYKNLQARQFERRKLDLEDLRNQRNLDFDLKISKKFIRVPDSIVHSQTSPNISCTSHFQRGDEDPILATITLHHHPRKREWCLRSVSAEMLVHIANNKSKMNPVYIKQSENSKSNSNSGNTVSMTYDVRLKSDNYLQTGHFSDYFRFPRDFSRSMNNLFHKSIFNAAFLQENYFQSNVPKANVDANELFEFLKNYHTSNTIPHLRHDFDPQHKSLIPILRPYQANAVRWMLSMEKVDAVPNDTLHPLFEEVTGDDGSVLYLNKYQGNILTNKPFASPPPCGGILADEMGLGKTVEVLALLLANVRQNVIKPEWKEPENVGKSIDKAAKKRRLRKREKSPVEFFIREENAIEPEDNQVDVKTQEPESNLDEASDLNLKNVEGNKSGQKKSTSSRKSRQNVSTNPRVSQIKDETSDSDDSDWMPESDLKSENSTIFKESSKFFVENHKRPARSGDSANFSVGLSGSEKSEESSTSSDEDHKPSTSSGRKKRKPELSESDDEEWTLKRVSKKNKALKSKTTRNECKKPLVSKSRDSNEAAIDPLKMQATQIVKDFKPLSILDSFPKKKPTISSMILLAIAEKNDMVSVSTSQIRAFVKQQNPKVGNKLILKEIHNHLSTKMIFNTTGAGAAGSFVINPFFNVSDSRKLKVGKSLDPIDETIEKVITDCCYNGLPHNGQLEREIEKILCPPREIKKKSSTYEELKKIYDEEMEVQMRRERRRRAWGGTFFDTKVEQCQYIECICGTEAESDEDPLHRIQCIECGVWQHSLCVKYDPNDPYRGDYLCPHCWMTAEPVESGATLIISPNAIVHQWIEEIQKHIKYTNINVLFYKGTKAEGYIQPRKLASYDLVITTYTTLQSEVNYVDLPHTNDSSGRRFRNPKRFLATPTALPCVNWWRVCLDEAQMIENPTSKTAEMALRLKAINRWCVSGTPLGKSLDDLYGLFVFLKVDPFNMYEWWNLILSAPYNLGRTEPLKDLLAQYMWRTSKVDVESQIDLPSQSEEVHWIRFSPVEEHFYRRIYYDASNEMRRKLSSYSDDLSLDKIDRKTVKVIMGPMLRLRQSCSHPQAVRGLFNSKIVKFTIGDLMTNLISKAKLECEDQNRIFLSCLNGLAGIDLIRENYEAAVDKYRDVLRFIDENKSKVKTDDLQRLHTLTNLSEVLKTPNTNLPRTLRDDKLDEEATEIRKQYLLKYTTSFTTSEDALKSSIKAVIECRESFLCKSSSIASKDEGAWYTQVIRVATTQSEEDTLLDFIREEMIEFYSAVSIREINAVRDRYTSIIKIKAKLFSKIDELDKTRDSIIDEMENFRGDDLNQLVQSAVDCHLRKSVAVLKNKEKCSLCNLNDQMAVYEGTLFHFVKGDLKVYQGNARKAISLEESERLEKAGVILHGEQRKGTWSDSEAERLLRALLKYSKQIDEKLSLEVVEDGKTHMKMYSALKKEFKALSVHCRLLFDQVAAYDELGMCTLRLRLRFPWEPKPKLPVKKSLATLKDDKLEKINVLEEYEVSTQETMLTQDLAIAKADFHKKLSQLEYLHNLENHTFTEGGNKEICPVCLSEFGSQWAVLECFHLLCMPCLTKLTENREVKCPICRAFSRKPKISFVDVERKYKSTLDREAYEGLKGNLPTKLSAIVCQLKKIEVLDPGAKSLVFSSWVDVLKALGDALAENGIKFSSLHERGSFVASVKKFKEDDSIKVLLIPFQTGASGLNLTVATHVFLAEPILHPGQEQQAIGRIHRIGQTKPTVVHRFIVKNTIEEKIYRLTCTMTPGFLKVSPNSSEGDLVTIKNLRLLFEDGTEVEDRSNTGDDRFDLGDAEDDAIARYVNT